MIDNEILRNVGGMDKNSLTHVLNFFENDDDDNNNELNMIKHSPYYNLEDFGKIISSKRDDFFIITLNVQSINAKHEQLNLLINNLNKYCNIDAICLQETWLSSNSDVSFYSLPNYTLISQSKHVSAHGGLAIYLSNSHTYNIYNEIVRSDIFENQIIEIQNGINNQKLIICNIYRPPQELISNYQKFTSELEIIMQYLDKKNKEVIICGDFNIDLLKINDKEVFSDYFEKIISNGFFPSITLPTRFSNRSATLIDNILYKTLTKTMITQLVFLFPQYQTIYLVSLS